MNSIHLYEEYYFTIHDRPDFKLLPAIEPHKTGELAYKHKEARVSRTKQVSPKTEKQRKRKRRLSKKK